MVLPARTQLALQTRNFLTCHELDLHLGEVRGTPQRSTSPVASGRFERDATATSARRATSCEALRSPPKTFPTASTTVRALPHGRIYWRNSMPRTRSQDCRIGLSSHACGAGGSATA